MATSRILLDTNVLLAGLFAPERLPSTTQQVLADPSNEVFFSAASLWEIAIKCSLGRPDFTIPPRDVCLLAQETGFTELLIESAHTFVLPTLPWHHKDPFDRLLVAQAMGLPAQLLTTDKALAAYSPLVCVIPWDT